MVSYRYRWDEVGEYDVPATIEYVLRQTGQEQLVFYGHSFGATVFFIAMIKHPELNAKVERMFAMGPTTSRHHSKNVLRHILPIVPSLMVVSGFFSFMSFFSRLFIEIFRLQMNQNMINRRSHGAFMRYGMIPRWFMRWRCENEIWQAEICRDMYFLGPSGSNPENFDLVKYQFLALTAGESINFVLISFLSLSDLAPGLYPTLPPGHVNEDPVAVYPT